MNRHFGIGTAAGRIGWDDIGKIVKGAGFAAIGAVGSAAAAWMVVEDIDLQQLLLIAFSTFLSVVGNALHKLATDTR